MISNISNSRSKKWEVVYFLNPFCSGTCAHCWSANKLLGSYMPVEWHISFFERANFKKIKELRITGGEPLEYKKISIVLDKIVEKNQTFHIPIRILTSGRNILSIKEEQIGIEEALEKLLSIGIVRESVEIHLSADEHHAGSFYDYLIGRNIPIQNLSEIYQRNEKGIRLMKIAIKNFLAACKKLKEIVPGFRGCYLEIHCEKGRLSYHKNIYSFISDEEWKQYVIATEGLFNSGRALNLGNNISIPIDKHPPIFIIPGAKFVSESPSSNLYECYELREKGKTSEKIYLVPTFKDSQGAAIIGFHNLVYNYFCGGSADDALKMFLG
ncbi:MAG: radical SAM protein [Athalassotoga sp.]|uniref:radical SAM protein n=1 Tax=Athalassotoga sp. TaxID=2022597 RepID=UPI003CFFFCA7